VVALLAAMLSGCSELAPAPKSSCAELGLDVRPLGPGPLVLQALHCFYNHAELPPGAPVPSPDATAFFLYDGRDTLWVGRLDDVTSPHQIPVDLVAGDRKAPFAWSGRGDAVLGARQSIHNGSMSYGPLQPFVASVDGSVRPLPALEHSGAPLRELHWVGDAGLAVALFGTDRGYEGPSDRSVTIAFVDARAGRVLQSVTLADLVPDASISSLGRVQWQVDRRNRVTALVSLDRDRWMLWEEGQPPRLVPIIASTWLRPFALSPDGRSALIMGGLSATGVMCESWSPESCPLPTPATGAVAQLVDVETGKVVWSLSGTATGFSNDGQPAISPDGRYALISLPARLQEDHAAALIDMASGKILQKILSDGASASGFGFSADGTSAWISGPRRVAYYRLDN
jgi:hypothetical protein